MMQIPCKLGLFLWFGYRIPIPERIRLIREAGFETVLHWWDDSFLEVEGFSKEEQVHLIRNAGLDIENAHLRIDQGDALWLDNQDGQAVFEQYSRDIDGLAEQEIPVAVLHPTSGNGLQSVTRIGMERFRWLTEQAEKRGVRIALENVRNVPILTEVLDTIDSPMLGHCYDSGHDLIWSEKPYELLERYSGRLLAVHLHDNLGIRDDHLAPGEGCVDWAVVRRGIQNSIYTGSYTLEGDSEEIPSSRSPQAHLQRLMEGAQRELMSAATI